MVDLLILTSCINPPKQDFLMLTDQTERYTQMIDSIKYYITAGVFKNIVVCDGSNYNLENEEIRNNADINNINLEILYFNQDFSSVRKFGKGYGEGEIMRYIIENSQLYRKATNFIKITGRLKIININKIYHRLNPQNNYFNFFPATKIGCVDTRFYMIQKVIYESVLINSYKKVNDRLRNSYEYCFTDDLHNNNIRFYCFPEVPEFIGYSGTTNTRYGKDSFYHLENILTKLGIMKTKIGASSISTLYVLIKVWTTLKNFMTIK